MMLRRLPVSGVEALLAALSGQTPPPSLARVVFAETEGNPFFVEEVFRHLAEEGKLFDEKRIAFGAFEHHARQRRWRRLCTERRQHLLHSGRRQTP